MESAEKGILQLMEQQQQEIEEHLMQQRLDINKLMAQYSARVVEQLHGAPQLHASSPPLRRNRSEDRQSLTSRFSRRSSLVREGSSATNFTLEDASSACSSDSDALASLGLDCMAPARKRLASTFVRAPFPARADRVADRARGPRTLCELDRQVEHHVKEQKESSWSSWCETLIPETAGEGVDREAIVAHNRTQAWLLPIVHSCWFQCVVGCVVLLNVLLLGLEVDYKLTSLLAEDATPSTFIHRVVMVQRMFFCFFCFEMILRLLAEQVDFFVGPNWRWNLFEALIVVTNTPDFYRFMPGLQSLRSLRVIRIFRAIRIIRLFRFLQRFRLMVFSMLACFVSFMWGTALLLIVIFAFAIYLQDTALYYFESHPKDRNLSVEADIKEHWNGLVMSVESLIYSVSGGADWSDLAAPFMAINQVHGILYIGFIMFTTFMLLNVLVGVFVQESADLAYWDRELVLETAVSKQASTRNILGELFDEIGGNDGRISLQELEEALSIDRIRAYFAHLNIDMKENAEVFFQLLDRDSNHYIERDEFVQGCAELQGGAKPLELANLVSDCASMSHTISKMDVRLRDLSQQTAHLSSALRGDGFAK